MPRVRGAYKDGKPTPEAKRRYRKTYEDKYPGARKKQNESWREKEKLQVLSYYAGGDPKCAYCGFTDVRALCLDHINDDGAAIRKGQSTWAGWRLARKLGMPDGLQVLCANCNLIKEIERKKRLREG